MGSVVGLQRSAVTAIITAVAVAAAVFVRAVAAASTAGTGRRCRCLN